MNPASRTRSPRTFGAFLRGLKKDLITIWQGFSAPMQRSAVLAVITALILIAFSLFGPSSARVGAAIGLIALLIVLQITIMILLMSGRLIQTPSTERQLIEQALDKLRAGDFSGAVQDYRAGRDAGVPLRVIGALIALAEYLNGDRDQCVLTLREAIQHLPNDPARAWLIGGLFIICLIPPPGTDVRGMLEDIMTINQEGRAVWQAEADRFAATPYGQRLTALLSTIDQQIAVSESAQP